MKIIKVMSIIGIAISSLSFIIIVGFAPDATVADGYTQTDIGFAEAAMGWGIIACIWGIAFAVTCLVQSTK
jgi:hypothetical protein